jgi:beta-lactamase regulating signal transducer with metallopeptidase domain
MIELTLTSAILIIVILTLRHFLKGKISLRLQYAIWALVLVRLLLPINLLASPISVLNAMHIGRASIISNEPSAPVSANIEQTDASPVNANASPNPPASPAALDWGRLLSLVWYTGIAAVVLSLFLSNLNFSRKLRKTKTEFPVDHYRLKVYIVENLPSPCLYGLPVPSVYITSDVIHDKTKLDHVLTHELCHYQHGDHIWSFLRSLCLAVYWFNPLVWLAAAVSRRDAELACDESTILRLGEANRMEYGRTLIDLTCQKRSAMDLLCYATTMTDSKKGIQERITLIAKNPKTAVFTMVTVFLILALTVGCTFTGAKTALTPALTAAEPVKATESYEGKSKIGTALDDGHGGYLLPLREILEAQAFTVVWDSNTQTMHAQYYGTDEYVFTVGSSVMELPGNMVLDNNGRKFDLGGPVVLIDGKPYAPAVNLGTYMAAEVNPETLGIYMVLTPSPLYTVYDGKKPLTKEQLQKVTKLTIINVDSLDFLKDAVNLTQLKAGNTDMTDTGEYAATVSGDISALAGLTKLTNILLFNTNVTGDIGSLGGLTDLDTLYLNSTKVSGDISGLNKLSKLKNIGLTLQDSDLITGSLSALSGMSQLESIQLSGKGITGDTSALAGLKNLDGISLVLAPNVTGDLSVLKGLKLTGITLYDTAVTVDLSTLSGFTELQYLGLRSDSIKGDLSALSGLTKLIQLFVMSPNVTGSISALKGSTDLVQLYLSTPNITGDISALSGLTNAMYIMLPASKVSGDIGALSGLVKLTKLDLSSTNVSGDIGALAGLKNLTDIKVTGTKVTGQKSA